MDQKEFTKRWLAICDLETVPISPARKKEGRRGVAAEVLGTPVETEIDYERHFDYIHYNPAEAWLRQNCPHA
ncbi:MAG: hypothetical protein R3C12_12195 [Planctomycetaceae bacterium]